MNRHEDKSSHRANQSVLLKSLFSTFSKSFPPQPSCPLLRLISWNLTTRCLAITGSGGVGECDRLSQPAFDLSGGWEDLTPHWLKMTATLVTGGRLRPPPPVPIQQHQHNVQMISKYGTFHSNFEDQKAYCI